MEVLRNNGKQARMPFMGERLDQAIRARKTSQRQLGIAIKVEPSRVSEYKTGKRQPDITTAEKIAEHLNIPLDYLYGRVNQIEILDLSDAEVALILNHRRGSENAVNDAIVAKMDSTVRDK